MLLSIATLALLASYVLAKPIQRDDRKSWINATEFVQLVQQSDLQQGAQRLQSFADAPDANGTRSFGSPGHIATVDYLYNTLSATGAFNVTKQTFEAYTYESQGNSTLVIDGRSPAISTPSFSPGGSVSGTVVPVDALGCEAANFPAAISGAIALVSRGECDFGLKVALSQSAGAVGCLVANNDEAQPDNADIAITLGEPTRPEGQYVPTVIVSLNEGNAIRQQITSGSNVTASIEVFGSTRLIPTTNVLAETYDGDHDNVIVVGAHTDSVPEGAGINDDGSGTITNLEAALNIANYRITNAVRFGFWTAEEVGLVGSEYYVASLNQAELNKIRMNLNFDMLASPNYYYSIYDGDGSAFGLTGPDGSGQIELLFEQFFAEQLQLPTNATEFDGRSDYGPFLDRGIPCGGLFTGAEANKTIEIQAEVGGEAGVPFDINYHEVGDTIDNLNYTAWIANTKAVFYAIATYANSLEGFPANNATFAPPVKRSLSSKEFIETGCHHDMKRTWLI